MQEAIDYRLMTVSAVQKKFFLPGAVKKREIVDAIKRGELVASFICGKYLIREDDARSWIATPIPAQARAKKTSATPVSPSALKIRSVRANEKLRALGVIK